MRTGLKTGVLTLLLAASWAADRADSAGKGWTAALRTAMAPLREAPREDSSTRQFRYEALFESDRSASAGPSLMTVDPDDVLFWKFIPGRRGSVLGQPFAVNSDGLWDEERPALKRAGTARVAVLGSSTALGYGVAPADAFSRRLEGRLGPRVEVVNLSVPGYSLSMMMEQYARKAIRYRPDVVLVCLSGDAALLDSAHLDASAHWAAALRRRLFPQSMSYFSAPYLRALTAQALAAGVRTVPSRFRLGPPQRRREDAVLLAKLQLRRLGDRIRRDGGAPVAVFLPAPDGGPGDAELRAGLGAAAQESGMAFWDLTERVPPEHAGYFLGDRDGHFSARGHALVAEGLEAALRADPGPAARLRPR